MKKIKIITNLSLFLRGTLCRHSEKDADRVGISPAKEEFERCVMCGEFTNIPVSLPIDLREDYEIGCGQLCNSCRLKLQDGTEKENSLS